MSRKYLKTVAAVAVLVVTLYAFVHFIAGHPDALRQLKHVHPLTFLLLLGLYALTLVCLAFVQEGTLQLCHTKLKHNEAFLLTSYTAIINFFGPLQSGPGFRAVYLKKKYGTKLKNYVLASLLYFAFYAGVCGMFLLSGLISWWWLTVMALGIGLLIMLAFRLQLPGTLRLRQLRLRAAALVCVATAAQLLVMAIIFYTELHSINPSVSFHQALIYTGAAGLALFVSITPGAIGFRESFLVFSQHLHHISSTDIVSANLLDRGMYIVYLGILVVIVTSLHAKQRLLRRMTVEQQ